MAIDTENKRRSVQAYTFGLIRPVPDGTIDANDRATAAWLYSGAGDGGGGPVGDNGGMLRLGVTTP
jgi:hypothetical protein